MSHTAHGPHLAHKALEELKKTADPLKGAGFGAIAAGGAVPTALALAGLALTPVGWAVALGAGAAAGVAYVSGKNNA